ncbi:TIGR03915 family putative DNA repair protein [Lacrimispora sp. JR3]|uniref:TIGR03915 family putative DNA repair protein n=1 Tax=Lacrimispora sinapis TaxID=3111456 RepID=UPI003749ED58
MKTVYLCENSVEGILSGVYTAWTSKKGHNNVKLQVAEEEGTMELFCQYEEVPVSLENAQKVVQAIKKKISGEAYTAVYKAALSIDSDRADKIYRYLVYGFHIGSPVVSMLQLPAVYDIFQICRFIDNETHLLTGFVRFSEMEGGLLVGRIGPKNDVLVLLAPHFADRMSNENWVLYDEKRKKAVLHPANHRWFLADLSSSEWETKLKKGFAEDEYEALFKCFRKSITIKERKNPICQQNHMPLRYRPYMPEFSDGLKDT